MLKVIPFLLSLALFGCVQKLKIDNKNNTFVKVDIPQTKYSLKVRNFLIKSVVGSNCVNKSEKFNLLYSNFSNCDKDFFIYGSYQVKDSLNLLINFDAYFNFEDKLRNCLKQNIKELDCQFADSTLSHYLNEIIILKKER